MTEWNPNANRILAAAIEFDDHWDRQTFIARECGDDEELRGDVDRLVSAHFAAGDFLEPAAGRPDCWPASNLTDIPIMNDEEEKFDFLQPSNDPTLLGHLAGFEVIDKIRSGGMGIVFRARDPHLNRIVAIKVLKPDQPEFALQRDRFHREAESAAAIKHPNVIQIHEVNIVHSPPFIVMEYVKGQSLADRIKAEGRLETNAILQISRQIADGLSAIHNVHLIHRDIKPANILLENGVASVKIADFGLARLVDDFRLTQDGCSPGTPLYMSPEQLEGTEIDSCTDLFSLGVTMYYMCTGCPPFSGGNLRDLCMDILISRPHSIRTTNPDIPEWLEGVVLALLQKKREDRCYTAEELSNCLAPASPPQQSTLRQATFLAEGRRRSGWSAQHNATARRHAPLQSHRRTSFRRRFTRSNRCRLCS